MHGDLDWHGVLRLEPELTRLERDGVRDLTLDLGDLAFLDSTGLRLVIEAAEAAGRRDGTLRLWPGRDEVQRVFRVAGLEDVLPFDAAP